MSSRLNSPSPSQRVSPNTVHADTLLKNPIINKLCFTHVKTFYLLYSLLIIYFLVSGIINFAWYILILGILIGMLVWSLTEYILHRYAFHWKTNNSLAKKIVFIFHEVHHAYPQDVSRSITPPMFTIPIAILFYYCFKLLFGAFYCKAVFLGLLIGYIAYIIIHDSTHHYAMDFPLAKKIKRHHLRHHYFDNSKNFGVTSPLWDYVFGTYSKPRK